MKYNTQRNNFLPYPWKMSLPNFVYILNSQSIKIYPTMSKNHIQHKTQPMTNIVQTSQYQTTQQTKNAPKSKINLTTQWFPSKSYNIQKLPQEQTAKKWQCPTIKFSTKHEINKFTKTKQKNELNLKSFLDECGLWLLGPWRSPSSSFHSSDGWYFFTLNVRK